MPRGARIPIEEGLSYDSKHSDSAVGKICCVVAENGTIVSSQRIALFPHPEELAPPDVDAIMAPTPESEEFSAPGAASYSSDTMTVGDGTWVFSKNTFLLPNLQGTNFDTMRYNGL